MNAMPPFTNELIHETSPYLLQHAHNPVNWIPWSENLFGLASKNNKPILLSIGYAACHWCHVMERESFESIEVANFMNEHFINVKVDREERPDIDHIYMDALQAMTGSGGWPLNIFLLEPSDPKKTLRFLYMINFCKNNATDSVIQKYLVSWLTFTFNSSQVLKKCSIAFLLVNITAV